MSRSNPTIWEEIVLRVPCGLCGAQPGYWCLVVKTGKWATYLHNARQEVLREARAEGWMAREHYLAEVIDRHFHPERHEGAEFWLKHDESFLRGLWEAHAERSERDLCAVCESREREA